MKVIDPYTETILEEYQEITLNRALEIVENTRNAHYSWSRLDIDKKANLFFNLSEILLQQKQNLSNLMVKEMGKPISDALSEIEKCAWLCKYYGENGKKFLEDIPVTTESSKSVVTFQPLGTVLGIMPWNFPYWQVFRFVVPAMMAGNTALLKHAPNVMGCAIRIEELFNLAGFPLNSFKNLIVDVKTTEEIIKSPFVNAVTLTGSTRAGRFVAALSGELLKKNVLELGGSDPYLILEDADLELAIRICSKSRLLNCGQSCISAKRFIIHDRLFERFLNGMKSEFENAIMGDPSNYDTNLGPMARDDLRKNLHEQVMKSVDLGAHLETGGYIPDRTGYFYPPTILTNIKKGMPAYDEELFGPVASLFSFSELEEGISIANDTAYGLGAAVFSKNEELAWDIAKTKINAGCVAVNDMVKSDPRLPFGGIKQSGFGRELSEFGIREFVNIKTVYMK